MTLFEIRHRFTGAVLFSLETDSFKLCVEAAVKSRANLAGANLAGAYLAGAYLADANLAGAYLADANLAGAYLAGAYLADANLAGAYLAGANLAGAYLAGAYLADANLAGANLADAYLAGANLAGAYLAGANLADANLADANLAGAKIRDGITIKQAPVFIYGLTWSVSIFDAHMKIGCEFHSHDDWSGFDDDAITKMNGRDALKFWHDNKDVLLTLCRNHSAKANKVIEQSK